MEDSLGTRLITKVLMMLLPLPSIMQVALKFPSAVQYTGPLDCPDGSTAVATLCCLKNGKVLAIDVDKALAR